MNECFLAGSYVIQPIAFSVLLLSKQAATNCMDPVIDIARHHKNPHMRVLDESKNR
jgi:hypothetical protein